MHVFKALASRRMIVVELPGMVLHGTSLPVLGLRFNLNRRSALGHEGGCGRPEYLDHWELDGSSSSYDGSSGSGCVQM